MKTFICEQCSRKFDVFPCRAAQSPRFCSRKCYGESKLGSRKAGARIEDLRALCQQAVFGDACIEWPFGRKAGNYGVLRYEGRTELAHRIAYKEFVGPVPEDLKLCHRCDNPPCIRPNHLFLGTDGDNAFDCAQKGRHPHSKGESNPNRKLADSDVISIRAEYRRYSRDAGSTPLAERYGVSTAVILSVVNGTSWSHV